MDEHKERLADKVIEAYKAGMETNKIDELQKLIRSVEQKLNNVADLFIERKTDMLLKKYDELELQRSKLKEQLNSAELAQAHIPTRAEIINWFDRLQKNDGCENSLQRQDIRIFVHKVFLWDDHAVIVLTLNNTKETVTFGKIREFEQLSEEHRKRKNRSQTMLKAVLVDLNRFEFGSPDWT